MKDFSKKVLTVLFLLSLTLSISSSSQNAYAEMDGANLPEPPIVTDAWKFIGTYKADPQVLKAMLPEGLEPNPNRTVVINMYTVPTPDKYIPNGNETSGFGPYTLTYLTVLMWVRSSVK
ncbi:MAG: hypothetical protein WD000_09300 [Thermodesulfobacteriota bacterium]